MTKEEIQEIREKFELNGITCWMGEYKALHRALDALEQAQAEITRLHELSDTWADTAVNNRKEINRLKDELKQAQQSLKDIVQIVKLDASAFNELAAKVYEKALEALEGSE